MYWCFQLLLFIPHATCLDAQTSANRLSVSLSVTCTTLSSLPTFPSQGSGFFPGHHVPSGCPDVTSGVSRTHTTPIQAISSPNYLVNLFLFFVWRFLPPICFGRDWGIWKRKQNWGMSQWAEEKSLVWVGNYSSVLTSVCDLLGELLYLAGVIGALQCTVTTVEYVC